MSDGAARVVAPARRPRWIGMAAVSGASAAWGLGTVLSKSAIDDSLSPSVLLAIQLAAAVTALGVGTLLTRRAPRLERASFRLALPGLIEPGASSQLYVLGLAATAASTATIIFSAEPVMVVVLAWLFLGERASAPMVGLVGSSLVGVLLVVLPGQEAAGGALAGAALVVLGTFGAAIHGLVASRQVTSFDPLPLTWLHQTTGLVVAIVVLATELVAGVHLDSPASVRVWLVAVGSGVIQYGLPFWLYVVALRHLRVGVAAEFLALIPVFGVALSALLLDERLSPPQFAGGAIVLTSLVAIIRLEGREHEQTLAVPPWGDPEPRSGAA